MRSLTKNVILFKENGKDNKNNLQQCGNVPESVDMVKLPPVSLLMCKRGKEKNTLRGELNERRDVQTDMFMLLFPPFFDPEIRTVYLTTLNCREISFAVGLKPQQTNKLNGLSPRANYAYRATAASRRSD
jgi:hypothetical protein